MAYSAFEWDDAKCASNFKKHGLDFELAIQIFLSPVLLDHSPRDGEERWVAVGVSDGVEIAVVFTRRDEVIRIISARRARKNERRAYRQAYPGRSEAR
ncbi:MAG: BrnT family toxin [Magnetospirillum sp.]|nr:BrnT family toxin [Magnetospirillum sp.]